MSILSNVEIARALETGEFVMDPLPAGGPEDGDCYDTCSVHLHLGETVFVSRDGVQVAFDLDHPGSIEDTLSMCFEERRIPEGGWPLEPGNYVIATTRERIGFPVNGNGGQLAGRIEGRSRFARVGLLVHFTAPTIHAAWEGKVSLELKNLGTQSIVLKRGSAVCQLIVETVDGPLRYGQAGDFDNQNSPTGEW